MYTVADVNENLADTKVCNAKREVLLYFRISCTSTYLLSILLPLSKLVSLYMV